jgi:probable phosphoglycerate mutase
VTTTLFLVRHASHDLLHRCLVGRGIDVPLSETGIEHSERLTARLAQNGITHIKSSPRLRALQTARPLAVKIKRPIVVMREFDELNFGLWSGQTFDQLRNDRLWQQWNLERMTIRPPHGESISELQARVLHGISRIGSAHPNQNIAVVSHAEPIRVAILHFRGISLNEFARVHVDPGSLTKLQLHQGRWSVTYENQAAGEEAVAA